MDAPRADVVIVETGVGNLGSMSAVLLRSGATSVKLTTDPSLVRAATHVVLPGVGSFGSAMDFLSKADGLIAALKDRIANNQPTLCVCVGLQVLAAISEESPGANGFDLLDGAAILKFPSSVRVPQQCWNQVVVEDGCKLLKSGCAYFSNSYCLRSRPLDWSAAYSQHGIKFIAALERGNVVATQFHPELSGRYGTELIQRWLGTEHTGPVVEPALPTASPQFSSSSALRRVIPCLDVKSGRVVKGIQFQGLRDAGDPVELALAYQEQGADEIVFLDISATDEERKTAVEVVKRVRQSLRVPLTVGGGISSLADAHSLLMAGADKVSVNSAAVRDPTLISSLATCFGSQCVVCAIDATQKADKSGWDVLVRSGKESTGRDVVEWAKEAVLRGAGEILLTSFDRDGTRSGYDTALLKAVADAVNVPVIASGGASTAHHMVDAFKAGADAVLAASIFHNGETTVAKIKQQLAAEGVSVRKPEGPAGGQRLECEATFNRQCLVPSIDLMNGHAVQLVGGDPANKKLDAGDPVPLAEQFKLVGEIAVVDLDAALGRGDNAETIKKLLTVAPCRVGGGIRTVDKALEWLNAGAAKVVIGTAAKPDFLRQLPRERVVVALDARHGEVVVEGWQTKTGKNVKDCIRDLVEYAGGFLITFVEREGRLAGIDIPAIEELVAEVQKTPFARSTQITIAGGITTEADLAALDALGVEGQVGMALYTGRMDLGDSVGALLRSDRPDGLFPTVVADERGAVLGMAYSNRETLKLAIKEKKGIYYSRKRGVWRKGETSGAMQQLLKVDVDCDRDTLLFTVRQSGQGFCHRASYNCFGEGERGLSGLMRTLASRKQSAPEGSYTKRLFDDPTLLKAKLLEEATELADAEGKEHVANEAADLLYFALVACTKAGVTLSDVEHVLEARSLKVARRPGHAKQPFLNLVNKQQQETAAAAKAKQVESEKSAAKESEEKEVALKRLQIAEVWDLRRDVVDKKTREIVEEILNDVRDKGEEALVRQSVRLGDLKSKEEPYLRSQEDMKAAYLSLTPDQQSLLQRTADRVRAFAVAQKASIQSVQVPIPGGQAGHTVAPVDVAGCYAPGGRYPLPSSVLMTAITAKVAGCKQVLVASPNPAPVTLAAAYVAGADSLLAVGGAQAIAAFAYGIPGKIPSCDAIVGPGNKFVTAAKSLIAGRVAIDMLAGPSECLVLADGTAHPDVVAADLLAQAEHDVAAVPILVAYDEETVRRVEQEVEAQLATLPTAAIARAAFSNGFAVIVANEEEAITVCDKLAPEHLEVHTANAEELSRKLNHYGALFVGNNSAEVFGDYGAGPNHTLPTSGTGRSFGGLSVMSFLRVRTWLNIDDLKSQPAQQLVQDSVDLALLEGLHGHARSAQKRLVPKDQVTAASSSAVVPIPAVFGSPREPVVINFALPKGRMMDNVVTLLKDAGISINVGGRNLRPTINLPGWTVKLLKPRNVVEMIHHGTRDELGADDVVPYFDTGLDPVRVVVAAPEKLLVDGQLPKRHMRLATEYVALAEKWVKAHGVDAEIYKTFGSTEVFPPDDAEIIVDNTATGTTLRANQLAIVDEITKSSTFLCINRTALEDPRKHAALDEFVILLQSALNAREKALIEFNVEKSCLESVIAGLPSMKRPTISTLYGDEGFAVRSVIPRKALVSLVPWIKANGGSDVIVTEIKQVIV
ncbi:histidinol dehydrogenase [Acanthamoeba castellanii str. Neff]|uniref:Histidinol dehydrogenase n=3 Tax=Acanthamoeba TaxID=5754 RepID=L8GEH2_ACACF|nr:histidinol dehydrogenase [Acanthamoeba castellanii str. Neff]AVQ54952.1 histidinol dehydrogenase [Acanthamoeba polyphaga]AVQ54953.1 histidinol dehydrogenase [Acanthamoeba castellanii]ELR11500.1 histidinol dehydrogenase [Acanthamoeba castellanii str. Neff]